MSEELRSKHEAELEAAIKAEKEAAEARHAEVLRQMEVSRERQGAQQVGRGGVVLAMVMRVFMGVVVGAVAVMRTAGCSAAVCRRPSRLRVAFLRYEPVPYSRPILPGARLIRSVRALHEHRVDSPGERTPRYDGREQETCRGSGGEGKGNGILDSGEYDKDRQATRQAVGQAGCISGASRTD